MNQPLETHLDSLWTTTPAPSRTTASADSSTQTDNTTLININSQTSSVSAAAANVSIQTDCEQTTAAVQTQPSREEEPCLPKNAEVAAHKEGFEVGFNVGFHVGEECRRNKERIEWNKYHGPNICVWTQVKKTEEATQTEHPLSMESSTQTTTQMEPLDDEHPRLTDPSPPVTASLQPESQSSRSALLHDETPEPPLTDLVVTQVPAMLTTIQPPTRFDWAEDAESIPLSISHHEIFWHCVQVPPIHLQHCNDMLAKASPLTGTTHLVLVPLIGVLFTQDPTLLRIDILLVLHLENPLSRSHRVPSRKHQLLRMWWHRELTGMETPDWWT